MAENGGAADPSQIYASPIFAMAEKALDKLVILNYEEEFCNAKKIRKIPKVYFVLPNPKQNEQWRLFNMLCSWLCTLCTGDEEFFRLEEYDDPNTAANKLVLALKKLDFELDVPASKLKTPYGEAPASTLDFLTDKALRAKGFVWGRPVYKEDELFDAAGGEEEEEEEVIEEDVDVEEEEDGDEIFKNIAKEQVVDGIVFDESHQRILESNVDPTEWKTELERVTPKLKMPSVTAAGREWRTHIEQTKQHEGRIQQFMPDTKAQLQVIQAEVAEALEKMRSKERYINTHNAHLQGEYKEMRDKMKEIEEKYQAVSENVSSLTNDLQDLSDQLNDIKSITDNHGQSMTDTSPLVKIKAALQNIKVEIKNFDIRLGVVGHTLMAAKLKVNRSNNAKSGRDTNDLEESDIYDLDNDMDDVYG
eukprot:CAMPEP_0117753962 /NCGR_PEP_ID=MMETSP0947-20121206/12551_1 /TAXON_ID=44440 /ORGANISM="Chattonella subsalsa, Strain CCMP2191" /LENGTH=418 /DNA_ID=CAMNT_0005572971 /DNA_START=148 /DNA_END=1404 /DNA_ORIENTATION=+